MTFNRNDKKAQQIEQQRIDSKGAYVGTIKRAELVTNANNTSGVEFTFVSDSGAVADFIKVYTENNKGEPLMGVGIISAMMIAAGAPDPMNEKIVPVEKWVNGEKGTHEVPCYVDLHKKIGLVFRKKEYRKKDKSIGYNMEIVMPFDPVTKQTASEKLTGQVSKGTIDRIVEGLKDVLLPVEASHAHMHAGTTSDDFDTDIPF